MFPKKEHFLNILILILFTFSLAAQDRERREQERERERQHVRNEAQPLLAAAQAQGNSDVGSSTSGPVSIHHFACIQHL